MQIMQYNEARSLIKSGDVCAWSGSSLFSKIIKFWTRSEYSHVGIIYRTPTRVFIIEAADFAGIRIFPLSRLRPFFYISTEIKWSPVVEEKAMELVGAKYSLWGCVLAGLKLEPKQDNYWQCAEFVMHILSVAGMKLSDTIKTPVAITELFNNIIKVI